MKPKRRFLLIYAPITKLHLKTIERKYYSLVRTTIEDELQFEPDVETRNRKLTPDVNSGHETLSHAATCIA